MRGSVAKVLRREAKKRTIGLPERGYIANGTGGAKNAPQTTRGLYRIFKLNWKRGLIKL